MNHLKNNIKSSHNKSYKKNIEKGGGGEETKNEKYKKRLKRNSDNKILFLFCFLKKDMFCYET